MVKTHLDTEDMFTPYSGQPELWDTAQGPNCFLHRAIVQYICQQRTAQFQSIHCTIHADNQIIISLFWLNQVCVARMYYVASDAMKYSRTPTHTGSARSHLSLTALQTCIQQCWFNSATQMANLCTGLWLVMFCWLNFSSIHFWLGIIWPFFPSHDLLLCKLLGVLP